ncbi:translation initiation factor IF-2-like [Acinonyx jubatus]|uniref:Translation initiation factor IF-2-like n=1 Tax=Acinonyx jubatus TaxID=32536 RepID=A0ABM3PRT9_ACIJB|nr:translation initiation factor IF-2-like [Acinonyx jubatus]XP_053074393.1 translation initiation factor IF-2-like [Acinonyx jubatus]
MAVHSGAGRRKCPAPPSAAPSPQPRRRPRDTCLAAPGFGSTLHAPPKAHSALGGRREPRPWTRSLRAPPPAVPDISRGSLSPLLGGGEGDNRRPATLAPPGTGRSGSWPLAGAARCRPDYSLAAAAAAAAAAAEADPARAPARSLRPSPQRVQAAARRRRSRHPGVS